MLFAGREVRIEKTVREVLRKDRGQRLKIKINYLVSLS